MAEVSAWPQCHNIRERSGLFAVAENTFYAVLGQSYVLLLFKATWLFSPELNVICKLEAIMNTQ